MKTRTVTMSVEIQEHADEKVSIRIFDARGELFTRKSNISILRASQEIGACAFELPANSELVGAR